MFVSRSCQCQSNKQSALYTKVLEMLTALFVYLVIFMVHVAPGFLPQYLYIGHSGWTSRDRARLSDILCYGTFTNILEYHRRPTHLFDHWTVFMVTLDNPEHLRSPWWKKDGYDYWYQQSSGTIYNRQRTVWIHSMPSRFPQFCAGLCCVFI